MQKDIQGVDSVWVVLMGHGTQLKEKEYLITAKGNVFPVEEKLREIFSNKNNPALHGKPKIFIPSMCRGSKLELLGVSINFLKNVFEVYYYFLIL